MLCAKEPDKAGELKKLNDCMDVHDERGYEASNDVSAVCTPLKMLKCRYMPSFESTYHIHILLYMKE
jgi:hypothetical protein